MPYHQKAFDLNIWDASTVAYCVVELVLDEEGRPEDWIYRYCNQAFADRKEYRLESLIDHAFSSLSPRKNEAWLQAYYRAAYENQVTEMELEMEEHFHATIMPVGQKGFCSCMIYAAEEHRGTGSGKYVDREKYVLSKLSPEYVSIYRIDANSGKYEILRLCSNTNARTMVQNHPQPFDTFDQYSSHYADTFILPEDRSEFKSWFTCRSMKEELSHSEKINFHYHSVSKHGEHSFYEAYAVKGVTDENRFDIFLGFRNIDSILYKEKQTQMELKKALDEARLANEIISSIARTYQYISRIDLQTDHYEEIANNDKDTMQYRKSGTVSVGNARVTRESIAEEYQEAFLKFSDLSTLPERMAKEESIAMEYRMKDGSWHKLRFIEKKRDASGRLTNVLCAIRSISDTKKKEQDLLYQIAEAKKETALKTRFLSNMSHDIRTPLNGIMGMIEVANHYPEDAEVQRRCREQVMKSSQYLVSVVSDILAMSKLEAGDSACQEISFDLAAVLNRVNTERELQAAAKDVRYVVNWKKGELCHRYLVGNVVYLERLLTAVADNAVKFTGPGGEVCVWCIERPDEGDRVLFEFGCSDNGIGMSQEFLPHAFDMFSQENESSRSRYEGAGLGLAIAKRLADSMGGTIAIESKKGEGTTVVSTIPFRIDKSQEMQPVPGGEEGGGWEERPLEGLQALLAEDNELNTEVAVFLLEKHGIRVECARDGQEAAEMFESSEPGHYDVIFMDIMMPRMNGWDAARRIRSAKREDAASVPIIAMSANTFAEDIMNSHISGMNAHLAKPLEEEKLLYTIRSCIRKRPDTVMEQRKKQSLL